MSEKKSFDWGVSGQFFFESCAKMFRFIIFGFAAVVAFVGVNGEGFLNIYQRQFETLNREVIESLSEAYRKNSDLHRGFIEDDVLQYVGTATYLMQTVNKDVLGQMKILRNETEVDDLCLDTIEASLYMEIERSELWLQLCVSQMYVFLKEDVYIRFHPMSWRLHREASTMVRTAVDALSEVNPVNEQEEVEGRLDAELDHFNEVVYGSAEEFNVEYERHAALREAVVGTMHPCIGDLEFYFLVTMYNLLGFAYDTCLNN